MKCEAATQRNSLHIASLLREVFHKLGYIVRLVLGGLSLASNLLDKPLRRFRKDFSRQKLLQTKYEGGKSLKNLLMVKYS